ncbi:MAG: redox-regulated ATPase YchF [Patescibacteria group bacterium]
MNLSIAIVGLPNVGKSTLFNALLKKQQALSANYPFATIEPNIGIVPVPDDRLKKLAEITKEEEGMSQMPPIKPATVEFVDIAGLVKGAAEGAGLGNKFLSHIRETSIIAHVIRGFTDENVIREGSSDPEEDFATIQTELILADLQTVQNVKGRLKKPTAIEKSALDKLYENLNTGELARRIKFNDEEKEYIKTLFLITLKPEIIVLNVSENDESLVNNEILKQKYADLLQISENRIIVVCAKIEEELSGLSQDEQKAYLEEMGVAHSGLEKLIQKSYESLGLISFLTAGEKEVRAWTIKKGMNAVDAAGVIHTDFMKKFIKAEVVSYDDFVTLAGWKGAREKGRARLEGRDYIMQDGDVVEFKIGA